MGKVKLYALSTCGWCKKTKRFLDKNDIEYECTYVDLLKGAARDQVMAVMLKWNPRGSFPTVVVDDAVVVVGFKEQKLREVLEL